MYEYNLIDYVPDYMRDNEEFLSLIGSLQLVANDIKYFVDTFNDLVDIDTVPELFLPKLTYLLSYPKRYEVNASYQREMIKRMILVYKNKGTDNDILTAANNGTSSGWLGFDIFYPGYTPSDNKAKLLYTIDQVFTHNVSKWSMGDRYSDANYWRYGVLQVEVETSTPELREAVLKVVPAGVRFYLKVKSEMGSDGGMPTFGKWTPNLEVILNIHPKVIEFTDSFKWSTSEFTSGKKLWSGSKVIRNYVDLSVHNFAYMTREASHYRGTVTPVSQVLDMKAPDYGLETQWGAMVVQQYNNRSLDARSLVTDGSPTPANKTVDAGVFDNDYTKRVLDMSLLGG